MASNANSKVFTSEKVGPNLAAVLLELSEDLTRRTLVKCREPNTSV